MGCLPALERGETLEWKEPQTSPDRMWLMPFLSSPRSWALVLHYLQMVSFCRSNPLRTTRYL
jgi:hypothetical protein